MCMRTTLTLDDDVAEALKDRSRQMDRPFKQVVNDALRRGLSPGVTEPRSPYRVKPHHSGLQPGVDPLRLNQLNDALEADAVRSKRAE